MFESYDEINSALLVNVARIQIKQEERDGTAWQTLTFTDNDGKTFELYISSKNNEFPTIEGVS
jgi:hypothetical protein